MGERGHRARDRLRHRALHLQGEGGRVGPAVGGRASSCSCCRPIRGASCSPPTIPNGGSFMSYPELIRLLMDRTYRDEQLARVNQKLLARQRAGRRHRARVHPRTRSPSSRAPARRGCSGLSSKGHLGVGADADVTVYEPDAITWSRMFATPRYVVKGGVAGRRRRTASASAGGSPTPRAAGIRSRRRSGTCARSSISTRPCRSTTIRCGRCRDAPLARSTALTMEDPRRPHRGHFRGSVRHARGAARRSPRRTTSGRAKRRSN